ncbi:unnamed protein product [Tilletia laevis]|uniref:Mitochondrial K+-H+ exchange-related-domain-containing protein n=2 Tax=Tilletia TaxID=13289 RepID=A0A8X7MWK8_9BASI|nr:hypothetical protein CF336_g2587 [Tilletia laevis]KAE8204586.1 hypothetical protein CF328_g992 [Tilletia controversa]CAD6892473.1 unnamed protein product [Tilletia caries]KAE8205313.1 hypothetical protein CF335_g2345 [Tilletia laevis]KAE8251006.1 hypothetical protein A4X06_0g2852 [Tilletia controversa]
MRLIAVPLARLRPGSHPVATFLAQRAPVVINSSSQKNDAAADAKKSAPVEVQAKKLPLASRLSARASAFWVSLGEPNTKSTFDWKRRTHSLGERIMDTVEYDEWALKGIDPALAPSLKHPTSHQSDSEPTSTANEANPHQEQVNIPLLYPPSLLKPNVLLSSLRTLTEHRTPHHRKWFWVCFIGAPLTAPFALVPVIPNLPFFYLAWRAWSHWKAYQSSSYLSELIAQNRLVPTPSLELDQVYNSLEFAPRVVRPKVTDASKSASTPPAASPSYGSTSTSTTTTSPTESQSAPTPAQQSSADTLRPELLLCSADQIQRIINVLEIDEKLGLATDLRRAMDQTLKLLEKGQLARLEAAAEASSSTPEEGAAGEQQKKDKPL